MKVLITGGAGFIGSHLCDELVSTGKTVTILDNLSTGTLNNIAHLDGKIEVVNGDIRDQNLVDNLIQETDLVLHMAAALGLRNILEKPIECISTNLHGSEVILNSATKFDKRIIIASTSEIYGKNPVQPLNEKSDRVIGNPQKIRWSYSDAKALEEATAYQLYKSKNLRVTTLRFFNTVGPRQTGQYGMVVPRFVRAAILNEPLKVFGSGSQTRVFCHVLDAVKAILSIARTDTSIGEVFNIGGTGEISILDLAKLILSKTNSQSIIEFVPYEQAYNEGFEEMHRRVPDISKIESYTKWKPEKNLEKIIADVIEDITKGISASQNSYR
jgi:UDP-glucose 4-epimerase